MIDVQKSSLLIALNEMLTANIVDADHSMELLQGGTVGEVYKISGNAWSEHRSHPFVLVLKIQRKWERYGDADSWRREYDLYASDFGALFSDSLRWPTCYHAHINHDETQLWMEYIDGVSGLQLTSEMYVRAAEELGRFQGKCLALQPAALQSLTNLSKMDFLKKYYLRYRSRKQVYDYIRMDDCEIPRHLCNMIIDIDERADEIFSRIEQLPIVLCHRDFWVTNLFYVDGNVVLIDWDTAGWGYLCEDIASLIADEGDVAHMVEHYLSCIPAYFKGFSEYVDVSHITDPCIYERILLMFGYRLVESYQFTKSIDDKRLYLNTLQKIYEMKDVNANSNAI